MRRKENMEKIEKGNCRKTGKEVVIKVKYQSQDILERNAYDKGRIDYCPNGGCNNCPIYKEMKDRIYD